MTNEQMITVDSNVVIQVMDRLRADGWHKVLDVGPNGTTHALTTKKGEPQPDAAYDRAFLEAYREQHFQNVTSGIISYLARS